ncbi:hypothetical protein Aci011_163 [Acinetobacter phage vB_AbaM_B09_Aci01-1]|uniref:Uncharacterized protein n=1 Tax=Acinetobacter phage vB_AbaM_B09_Aci01-1 TaxID=2315466 RepID=A0A386KIV1_9CAUD|nr:hypothetical protein HOU29_gp018 [Acinetobacter phage vB_AbaM_B09_Aci01-1]AYD85578.1 hypothetical protein Aci011_163 [Acinetobacter phage vB_AbaM_B09_Aci01-1]
MKKLKTIDLCELTPELVKEYIFTGDDKADLLAILKIFRDWVGNPTSRTLKIVSQDGINNSFSLSSGICGNINFIWVGRSQFKGSIDLIIPLHKIFKLWPKCSGDLCYPIPNPYIENPTHLDNADVYQDISKSGRYSLYDASSKYGQLRLELLDFLIEMVKKDFDLYVDKY